MKNLTFLIFPFFLFGCSAKIFITGYAPEDKNYSYQCGDIQYVRVGPISGPKTEVIGPIIPIFPFTSEGKHLQINIIPIELSVESDCPLVTVNENNFTHYAYHRGQASCSYKLSNLDLTKDSLFVSLSNEARSCKTAVEEYIYFEGERYVPPGIVTR